MSLIRTLLIIVFVYYAFRFLARLFAPYLMKKMIKKMKEQQGGNSSYQKQSTVKEGETVIDKKPRNNDQTRTNRNVGEYVDFEEID